MKNKSSYCIVKGLTVQVLNLCHRSVIIHCTVEGRREKITSVIKLCVFNTYFYRNNALREAQYDITPTIVHIL